MKELFREVQYFPRFWFFLLLFPVNIVMIVIFGFGWYQQLYLGKPWGNEPMTDTGLIVVSLFVVLIMIFLLFLFFRMHLEVVVREDGIYYRYLPFIIKYRHIHKDTIASWEIRQYKAVSEYGGWGIKVSSRKAGIAYNVSGNMGLQLVLKEGKRILFGTQVPDRFKRAVDKMMKKEVTP